MGTLFDTPTGYHRFRQEKAPGQDAVCVEHVPGPGLTYRVKVVNATPKTANAREPTTSSLLRIPLVWTMPERAQKSIMCDFWAGSGSHFMPSDLALSFGSPGFFLSCRVCVGLGSCGCGPNLRPGSGRNGQVVTTLSLPQVQIVRWRIRGRNAPWAMRRT